MTQLASARSSFSRSHPLRWGILAAGKIAKAFARGVAGSATGSVVAVGSRSPESAERFGEEMGIARRHGSYESLLADDSVDAVYIATLHPMHARWAIAAAEAGKHILCEKPIALNHGETQAIIQAAREHGVFLMEAFMYRCHPQVSRVLQLIREGAIGEVRAIHCTFSFCCGGEPDSRLMNAQLGGGGILDVGCYTMSMARLIAGAALGRDYADPIDLAGVGRIGKTGVDEIASASLLFDGGIVASLSTGVRVQQDNRVRIFGSEGSLVINTPWIPARDGGTVTLTLSRSGKPADEIAIETTTPLYGLEADVCAAAIAEGRQEAASPAMTWGDTLGNMLALDRWRNQLKLVYPQETPEGNRPVRGSLQHRSPSLMRYGQIPHVDRQVARLIMGCDNKDTLRDAAPIWDDYVERGGNAFDTAHIYGRHRQVVFGQWLRSRGLVGEISVICKGAHTPNCDPMNLSRELRESLHDFDLPKVDIYIMHRDNEQVPVGEFVDVLNEHLAAGRISAIGGSNWSLARVQAFNDYAKKHGKRGFDLVSNNLSLAVMIAPVWPGCVHVHEPAFLEWLTQTQTAHLAWSSQARGFFASAEATGMPASSWDDAENRRRRERAYELSETHGCSAMNIAAAWVLSQPFPSFALIGPRTIQETATSLPAVAVQLTPEEMDYLDLKRDRP